MNDRSKTYWNVASLFLFLCLWTIIAAWLQWRHGSIFPYPWASFSSFLHMLRGKSLYAHPIWSHAAASFLRWIIGFSLAAFIGLFLGIAISLNIPLSRLFRPWLHVLLLIPGLSWVPVALLLFGIGNTGTIFMVAIVAISPIALATQTGFRSIPSEFIESAKILGAKRHQLIRHIQLPAAIPSILLGFRAGLGNSWRVLIAAEMIVGSGVGLGYIIVQSRWSLRFAESFAIIGIIAALGLFIEQVVFARLENLWLKKTGGQHE